jgi:Flp pilus assembly protein TadG
MRRCEAAAGSRPAATASRRPARPRLWRDCTGATAVIVAVSLPVLLAIAGLALDVGWWYTIRRQHQSAADAAALSAGYEVAYATGKQVLAAKQAATPNGYSGPAPAAGCAGPPSYVCSNYTDSALDGLLGKGKYQAIAVALWQTEGGWLSNFASLARVTIGNRAVGLVKTLPPVCMLALDPTLNKTVDLAGNAGINAPNCSIVSDSNSASAFNFQGSVSITAGTLITPGEVSTTGAAFTLNLANPAQVGANPVPDPFASILTHTVLTSGIPASPAGCTMPNPPPNKTTTIYNPPSRFCGGLAIKNTTVNLKPGTYWVTDGDLSLQANGILECTTCTGGLGVTIILTTTSTSGTIGNFNMTSNSTLNLTAPSTATLGGVSIAGMLILQDNATAIGSKVTYTSGGSSFIGGPGSVAGGLIYTPHQSFSMQGNPNSSCAVLIADTVQLQGTPTFSDVGCPNSLVQDLTTVKTVVLAE